MTADEARALSDARLAESYARRYMRMVVYPAIRNAAEFGESIVSIPLTDRDPSVEEVIEPLERDGYTVDWAYLLTRNPELRISW